MGKNDDIPPWEEISDEQAVAETLVLTVAELERLIAATETAAHWSHVDKVLLYRLLGGARRHGRAELLIVARTT